LFDEKRVKISIYGKIGSSRMRRICPNMGRLGVAMRRICPNMERLGVAG
jgi:hypothetical protein